MDPQPGWLYASWQAVGSERLTGALFCLCSMELCGPPASVSDLQLSTMLLSGRGATEDSAVVERQLTAVPFKVDSRFLGPKEAPGQHKGWWLVGLPVQAAVECMLN